MALGREGDDLAGFARHEDAPLCQQGCQKRAPFHAGGRVIQRDKRVEIRSDGQRWQRHFCPF